MTYNNTTKEKVTVNFAIKIAGHLAHDNNLFDMQCPDCKNLYSHFENSTCTKCGTKLNFLVAGNGKTMAISEGTIYPLLTDSEKKRHQKAIRYKKNAVDMVFRFKIFEFGPNDTTPPQIPNLHFNMKKGTFVKLMTINHLPLLTAFTSKDGMPKVEVCLHIFEAYGDKIEIVREARTKAEAGTVVQPQLQPETTPTEQVQPINPDLIAQLSTLLQQLTIAAQTSQQKTEVTTAAQSEPQVEAMATADTDLEAAMNNDEPIDDEFFNPFENDVL